MEFLHSSSSVSFHRGGLSGTLLPRSILARIAFSQILAFFPELTSLPQEAIFHEADVKHHILTKGLPVIDRARRLFPEKLVTAKAIFKRMVEDGICRPSSSPWASPIHMVKKKNGEWRVCGDYRRLNGITVPNRYLVRHLHDFASMLRGKQIFFRLDLHITYQQIPITQSDIPKTAIIDPFRLFVYVVMTFDSEMLVKPSNDISIALLVISALFSHVSMTFSSLLRPMKSMRVILKSFSDA